MVKDEGINLSCLALLNMKFLTTAI